MRPLEALNEQIWEFSPKGAFQLNPIIFISQKMEELIRYPVETNMEETLHLE